MDFMSGRCFMRGDILNKPSIFLSLSAGILLAMSCARAQDGDLMLSGTLPGIEDSLEERASAKPLESAKYVWSFSSKEAPMYETHGNVEIGRVLRGLEFVKSTRRGGDGQVAAFSEGSYVVFGKEIAGKNLVEGLGGFTLHIRMHSKWGHWRYPLLASLDESLPRERRDILSTPKSGQGIYFNWYSDGLKELLDNSSLKSSRVKKLLGREDFSSGKIGVSSNLRGMDLSWWHEFSFVYDGVRLKLYIDGVLLAENYPLAEMKNLRAPFVFPAHSYYAAKDAEKKSSQDSVNASAAAVEESADTGSLYKRFEEGAKFFEGDLDLVAFWDRALSDSEIYALSESRRACELLKMDYVGLNPESAYLLKSSSPDAAASFPVPLYLGTDCHLFYVLEKIGGMDKWGLGGAVIEHAKTDELGIFQVLGRAADITDKFQNSNEYPDAVVFGNKILLFHSDGGADASYAGAEYKGENIWISESEDGQTFTRRKAPAIKNSRAPFCVFEYDGKLYLYMSDGGVWVSKDSISWKKQKREWKTDKDDFTKWIDIFKMGEKWRMVCGDGRVFSSENPLGKWEETSERLVGGLKYPRFSVSAADKYGAQEQKASLAGAVYRGSAAVAILTRDIIDSGGMLLAAPPRASQPESGLSEPFEISDLKGNKLADKTGSFRLKGLKGRARAFASPVPVSLKAGFGVKVLKAGKNAKFGVRLNSSKLGLYTGLELELSAADSSARLIEHFTSSRDKESGEILKTSSSERSRTVFESLVKNGSFPVEILFSQGVADVYLDSSIPLSGSGVPAIYDCAEFFAENCDVEISNLKIEPAGAVVPKGSARPGAPKVPKRSSRFNR